MLSWRRAPARWSVGRQVILGSRSPSSHAHLLSCTTLSLQIQRSGARSFTSRSIDSRGSPLTLLPSVSSPLSSLSLARPLLPLQIREEEVKALPLPNDPKKYYLGPRSGCRRLGPSGDWGFKHSRAYRESNFSDFALLCVKFFGGSEINPSPPAVAASGNNAHMLYIFNRNGVCLLYKEWNRQLRTLNSQQDHKLMFGLLFSLKSMTAKMDPTSVEKVNLGVPQLPGEGCSFHSFRTNTYKLTFMETPSGIKLILVTHPKTGDLRESLKYIYNLYVEYVVKNPLYTPGSPIRSEPFSATLDQYVRGLG